MWLKPSFSFLTVSKVRKLSNLLFQLPFKTHPFFLLIPCFRYSLWIWLQKLSFLKSSNSFFSSKVPPFCYIFLVGDTHKCGKISPIILLTVILSRLLKMIYNMLIPCKLILFYFSRICFNFNYKSISLLMTTVIIMLVVSSIIFIGW